MTTMGDDVDTGVKQRLGPISSKLHRLFRRFILKNIKPTLDELQNADFKFAREDVSACQASYSAVNIFRDGMKNIESCEPPKKKTKTMSKQTSYTTMMERFKAWAERMSVNKDGHLTLIDARAVAKSHGKIILPRELFQDTVMAIHTKDKSAGPLHRSFMETVAVYGQTYTMGRRQFGISEDGLKKIIDQCSHAECSRKKIKKSKRSTGKKTQLSPPKDSNEKCNPPKDDNSKRSCQKQAKSSSDRGQQNKSSLGTKANAESKGQPLGTVKGEQSLTCASSRSLAKLSISGIPSQFQNSQTCVPSLISVGSQNVSTSRTVTFVIPGGGITSLAGAKLQIPVTHNVNFPSKQANNVPGSQKSLEIVTPNFQLRRVSSTNPTHLQACLTSTSFGGAKTTSGQSVSISTPEAVNGISHQMCLSQGKAVYRVPIPETLTDKVKAVSQERILAETNVSQDRKSAEASSKPSDSAGTKKKKKKKKKKSKKNYEKEGAGKSKKVSELLEEQKEKAKQLSSENAQGISAGPKRRHAVIPALGDLLTATIPSSNSDEPKMMKPYLFIPSLQNLKIPLKIVSLSDVSGKVIVKKEEKIPEVESWKDKTPEGLMSELYPTSCSGSDKVEGSDDILGKRWNNLMETVKNMRHRVKPTHIEGNKKARDILLREIEKAQVLIGSVRRLLPKDTTDIHDTNDIDSGQLAQKSTKLTSLLIQNSE